MVPFVGPSYELRRKKADTQRSVNLFVANIESGSGKSAKYLCPVPGLAVFSELPDPVVVPPDPSYDPCLKFLMHLDGNLTEEVNAETVATDEDAVFTYGAGKFGNAFSWTGARAVSEPADAWVYDGAALVPSALTTGWTMEFFTNVQAESDISGHAAGANDWLIIDGAASDLLWFNFHFGAYRSGRTGGAAIGTFTPGSVNHLAFVFAPLVNTGAVQFFLNGVHIVNMLGDYSAVDFSRIVAGDSSTLSFGGTSYRSYGFIDEFAVWACPMYVSLGIGVEAFTPRIAPIAPT